MNVVRDSTLTRVVLLLGRDTHTAKTLTKVLNIHGSTVTKVLRDLRDVGFLDYPDTKSGIPKNCTLTEAGLKYYEALLGMR